MWISCYKEYFRPIRCFKHETDEYWNTYTYHVFLGIASTPNRNISDTQTHKEDEWQGQTPNQSLTISAISGHQWSNLLSDWFLPIEYFYLLLPAEHQKLLSLCPALFSWQGHLRAKSGSKGFVWKVGHGLSASWVLDSSCWCQWP